MPPPVNPKAAFDQAKAMFQKNVPGLQEMFGKSWVSIDDKDEDELLYFSNDEVQQSKMQKGICWALSMKWINLHAISYQDKSENQHKNRMEILRKEFMPICGLLQKASNLHVKETNKLGISSLKSDETMIDKLGENFLVRRVTNRHGVKEGGHEFRAHPFMSVDALAKELAVPKTVAFAHMLDHHNRGVKQTTSKLWRARSYHLLLLDIKNAKGERSGHACAAYCSSGKILGFGKHIYLFDPNQGEFKLTEDEFKKTLKYWRDNYYYRIRHFTIIPVEPFGPYGRRPAPFEGLTPGADPEDSEDSNYHPVYDDFGFIVSS